MDYNNIGIGKLGVALAALVAIAMCILSLIFHPVEIFPAQYGFCLPSPDSWEINPFLSWLINTLIIGLIAVLLWVINKNFNFVRTTEPALPALFLIIAVSCPWFTEGLNSSVLLCLANTIGLGIIFASFDSKNATHQMFLLGIVVGIGSLFQYAFLPMAFVYFLWALFMKVLRVKEILALIAGILCPYWIALGFGLIEFKDIHAPSFTPLLNISSDRADFLFLLSGIALAIGIGFLVFLMNSVKLYAGNSKVYLMNLCVLALGAASALCIFVDFENMQAYVITLYMTFAVQLANICALWNPKEPWLVTALPSSLYIAIFLGSLFL